MDKAERDKVMSMTGNEVRPDFGQIMQEITSEAESSGGARSKQHTLSERKMIAPKSFRLGLTP